MGMFRVWCYLVLTPNVACSLWNHVRPCSPGCPTLHSLTHMSIVRLAAVLAYGVTVDDTHPI